jgi:hypothetical protein
MVVSDGNFALGCGLGTDHPYTHIFQCMLERTVAITNKVLEQITFVLAYPTVYVTCNVLTVYLTVLFMAGRKIT